MITVKTNDTILVDGLDDALLGYDTKSRAVYSVIKIIQIFMERDGMTHEEAIEWMEYNVVGAWVGETTPIFVHEIPPFMQPEDYLEDLGFDKPANDNGLQN